MKNNLLVFASIFVLILNSCNSIKTTDNLSNATWELEYISGPRIAFGGLYPDKKPQITFDTVKNEVSGNNSCNGYMTKYTLSGKSISFGEPGPTTMMFCEGGGDTLFLQTMKKITSYVIDKDEKLNLLVGDVPMMRFKKVIK